MFDFLQNQGQGGSRIEMGSVGWDDEDDYFFLGTGENDGHTLVRVQLFQGRDTTKPLDPSRAQGVKLICHISGQMFRVPKKDTRVFIAIPGGMESVPGAGVIFATVEKSPDQTQGDRAVMDFGPDTHVIIKGKSVSLQDADNRFISVGSPRSGGAAGLTFQAADGSGGVIQEGVVSWFVASNGDAKSVFQMTASKVECMNKTGGMWKLDQNFYTLGTSVTLAAGAVYLGKIPTIATPAVYGPIGITGVGSTSVFISP